MLVLDTNHIQVLGYATPAGGVGFDEENNSRADETGVVNDVNPENNPVTSSINLWIDSDGDGLPDWWEVAHELDPNDSSDALLDNDRDGLTNLEEYLAGTDRMIRIRFCASRRFAWD